MPFDVAKIEGRILKGMRNKNGIGERTQVIHDTLRSELPFAKEFDPTMLCFWCMVDRMYRLAFGIDD